jgi:hypothetical protein
VSLLGADADVVGLVESVITKDFRTYTMIFLRQEKSLRDHGDGLGTWRNANTSGITSVA